MPLAVLTKTSVAEAEPKAERYDLFDERLKGFGVRVTPNGVKTFFINYRTGDGGRRAPKKRHTIGRFGHLTVDEAREIARSLLAGVRLGEDPAEARKARRGTATVNELAETFLAAHVSAKRKSTTAALYKDVLHRLVLPAVGTLKVDALSRAELAKLHSRVGMNTPFQANRMLAIVGSMYTFGAKAGLVPEGMNPSRGIERFREKGRERFLSSDEIERLLAAIARAETEGLPWQTNDAAPGAKHLPKNPQRRLAKLSPHVAAALKLLLLTGARLREILHLKWSEVDLERGMLFLSDSKTGRKQIVLNAPAITILSALDRLGEYVICGNESDKPRSDLKRPWAAVQKAAGLEGVRLHDLRHTYASIAASQGASLPIIGKLMGHHNSRTTERYAHLANDPVLKVTNAVGAAITGAERKRTPAAANDDAPTPPPQRAHEAE